jgi:predicted RNase H-like nuclease (RuvC/YqgF family)
MEKNIDYKKEFDLACEKLAKQEKKIENLKEKVRFLEECLDRKEKLNEKLREELSAYDREYFDEDKKANNIFIDKS